MRLQFQDEGEETMPTRERPSAWIPIAAVAALALVVGASTDAAAQQPLTEGYRLVATWRTTVPTNTVPPMDRPLGLDVAADNTVYVADSRRNGVYRLAATGEALAFWAAGGIGSVIDVATSSDRMYVLGQTAGSIHRLDGTFVRAWPISGGQGVAFGPDRRVYVSRMEQGRAVVDVFDVDGNRLETWRDDRFPILSVFGLDVGPDGKVYLAGDGTVYIFSPGGQVTDFRRVPRLIETGPVTDVAVDGTGRIFATMDAWLVAWNGVAASHYELAGARRLAIGPGGGLAVSIDDTTTNFHGLSFFANRGALQEKPARWTVRVDETLGQMEAPRRVALGTGGDVLFLDRQQRVQRWSSAGRPIEQWPLSDYGLDLEGGAGRPCLAFGAGMRCVGPAPGNDWVVGVPATGYLTGLDGDASRLALLDLADQKVFLYGRDQRLQDSWPLPPDPGDTRFRSIADIALAADAVYLADQGTDQIDIRNLDGTPKDSLALPTGPVRLAVAGGNMYVLGRDGWIWKFGPDKRLLTAWQPAPDGAPNDIAATAAGRVYVADPKQHRILVFEPGAPPPASPPPQPGERCTVNVDKRAAPDPVVVGEAVTVQLSVRGTCPLGDGRLDVVLVIDQSGSMDGAPMAAAQAAALAFVNELNPAGAQVAVVAFSTSAEVTQPLSGNLAGAVRAIARLTAAGQTNYQDALDKARSEATGPAARAGVPHIAVMMTDGRPTNGAPSAMAAADAIKSAGITLYTIGLGTTLDSDLLRDMASQPDYYFETPSEAELADVYREIARRIRAVRLLKRATVTDEIPSDMTLIGGSAVPAARVTGRTLTWELTDVPATGRTLSYRVRPTRTGKRPTNVRATLAYVDANDEPGQLVFPVPEITVVKPARWDAYLPILYKNRCQPQRADVVLAIDSSISMTEPERPGSPTNKLQAAVAAAHSFLDVMELPGDQAAVVSFNSTARLAEGLTGSRAALNFALANLTNGSGTRIDLGIQMAVLELMGSRHRRANNPVIIVLTDGQPSAGTASQALAAGREARGLGFVLYTVGLGDDADMGTLRQVAGRADRAFFAPDAAGLTRVYGQIAGKALCEP